MVFKLAFRNLFHDRVSLIVTLVGIVFSVVLVAVQLGLYIGSSRLISAVIDHTKGDIWVVPLNTKNFDDPNALEGRERHTALSTPGVEAAAELVVSFGQWRKPNGGTTALLLIGSDLSQDGLAPWNIIEGKVEDLEAPDAITLDRSYLKEFGLEKIGDSGEINGQKATLRAVTKGIRSFTTLAYVFTSLRQARSYVNLRREQASFTVARLALGADIEAVKAELRRRLPDAEVLTREQFRERSLDYWLFETGAGAALIAGAILGLIVGLVVVAQTLYASTKDHLNEFATLRALGASAGYIHRVILCQALISAVVGYAIGLALSLLIVYSAQDSTLPVIFTPGLGVFLLGLTIGMCVLSAMSAIIKVTRIDPAMVFSR
ncbi:MAG: FtsX-like permease family protein [Hyphomicrobiaceae bacterium]|nr:MAG: FtsX-like permease family protein [Hyphomicrobiaceae bacterium]